MRTKLNNGCLTSLHWVWVLGLAGCGQGTDVEEPNVGQASEALINAPDTTNNDATNRKIAIFGPSSGAFCTGIALSGRLLLTSSSCASTAGITATPSNLNIGRVVNPGDTDFADFATRTGTVLFATDGNNPNALALVQVGSGGGDFSSSPPLAMASLPATPAVVSVSGMSSTGTPRQTATSDLTAKASSICVTPQSGQGLFDTDPGLDEGAPVFSGDNLVGIATTDLGGCDPGDMRVISVQNINNRLKTGTFVGNNVPFTAYLGGTGLFHEVSVFVSGGIFRSETGIPRALASLYAQGTAPVLDVTQNLSLPQSKTTPGTDSSADDNVTDIVVSVSSAPTASGDGTTDHDNAVATEATAPLTLSAGMGMTFVLSGADVINTSNNNAARPSWKGFPSPDGRDGRFVRIGPALGSPKVSRFTAFLNCTSVTTPQVEVFDADSQGAYDNNGNTTPNTCLRISVDPDGSGPGTVTNTDCIQSALDSNATFTNDGWFPFYNGAPFDNCPSSPGIYRFDAILMDPTLTATEQANDTVGCAAVSPDEVDSLTELGGVRNNFKIRTNCEIDLTGQNFTFSASDANGEVFSRSGTGDAFAVLDTTYERTGTFAYKMNTQGITTATPHVKSTDVDDCDFSNNTGCGDSVGASRGVHFLPLSQTTVISHFRTGGGWAMPEPEIATVGRRILNSSRFLAGTNPTPWPGQQAARSEALRYQNPSGQFDGLPNEQGSDVVDFQLDSSGDGSEVAVIWRNVRAQNGYTIFIPSGSPIIYPILSNDSEWRPVVQTRTAAGWAAAPTAIAPLLPIEFGDPGGRRSATTVAQAQALLLDSNPLVANLAAATLNQKLGVGRTIDLNNAIVRGSTALISDAVKVASQKLASGAGPGDELTVLVGSNEGLFMFHYVQPELPPDEDEDEDGLTNVQDNCSTVPNPGQENVVIVDDIGDACDPTPIVECAVRRANGRFTAFFGYNNPFSRRQLGGDFNRFLTGAANRGQPSMFEPDRRKEVFAVDSTGAQLSWRVAGNTAITSASTPTCTAGELYTTRAVPRGALIASERIEVGDRFTMTNNGGLASGSMGALLGFDSNLGDVFTTGTLTRKDRAHINGSLRANALGTPPPSNPTVSGLSTVPGGVFVEDISVLTPPAGTRISLTPVPNDGTLTLAPGAYQHLSTGDRATVNLSTGTYDFNTFVLRNDGRIIVNDSAGPVRVIIRGATNLQNPTGFGYLDRAATTSTGGGQPKLLVTYTGTQTVQLFSAFSGFIHAANAQLELIRAPVTNGLQKPFAGVFIARRIIAGHDVRVTYFDPPLMP